jgi:hypothetical protein
VCGIPGNLAMLDAAVAYVRECGLLPLRVAKTAITGAVVTPFRAVLIEVENAPDLREFRKRTQFVGVPTSAPPRPPPPVASGTHHATHCGPLAATAEMPVHAP